MKRFRKTILSLIAVVLVSAMLCAGATINAVEPSETTMDVSDDLAVTFTMEKTKVTGDGNYAVITHTYADGRADTEEKIPQDAWAEEETAYKFTYDTFAAKEMTDTLSVVVYDTADSPVAQWTTTVYDIVTACMTATTSESRRALLEATLEYAAAAQLYFGYAAGNLANKGLNAEDSHLNTIRSQLESSRNDASLLKGSDTSVIYGASCILGNTLQLRVYFTDNSKQVFVNGTEVQLQASKTAGYYYYTVDVAAKEIFDSVTIVVKDNDAVVATARDSVASYCARLYKQADEKDVVLADAILTYGLAAKGLKQEVTEPTVVGTYAYNGVEQTLELDGFDGSYMTVSGNTQTNAGSYEAVVTLNGNYEWANGADGKIAWTIAQQELSVTDAVIQDKNANGVLDDAVVESVSFTGLQNGESLTRDEDYTVTAVYDTAEDGEAVPVTVTVTLLETDKTKNYTLPNGTFRTTGKVTEPVTDKFTLVFENTEQYLYRVGNKNVVELGSLFAAPDDAKLCDVTVTVTSCEGGATGAYTANDDWAKGKVQFSGTGVVKVTIAGTYANPLSLYLEVVDGYNVTAYSGGSYPLKNQNSVLLNDIAITENAKYTLSNATLYGNGFTFDVTAGKDSDTTSGNETGNYTIGLTNAVLDNVVVKGEVYTSFSDTTKGEYNFPTVLANGTSVIANSYISNGASPVRTVGGCKLDIINSTLEGGIFANLDIRGGTIALKDVTTINQSDAAGNSLSNDQGITGLGVVIYSGNNTKIVADGLTQYNCISEKVTSNNESAQRLIEEMFSDSYTAIQFTDSNGVKWVNAGILSMVEAVGDEQIEDISGYVGMDVEMNLGVVGGTKKGYVYTPKPTEEDTAIEKIDDRFSAVQHEVRPSASFDYTSKNNDPAESEDDNTFCSYNTAEGRFVISVDAGESYSWSSDILTVKKNGNTLNYTVSASGGVVGDNMVTFSAAGDYLVTYTYSDPYNYRLDDSGAVEQYTVEGYTKTVTVTVYVVENTNPATFDFLGKGYRNETAGGLDFVMPDVTATVDSTSAGIGKVTVDGVDVYYPIVSVHKIGNATTGYYNYFSAFEAVTITDADGTTVYNLQTETMPSNLSVIGGFIINASGTVGKESANGKNIFALSTGKEIFSKTASDKDSHYGLCYYPDSSFTTGTSERPEQTIVAKYCYTDSNAKTYYYYVGYWYRAGHEGVVAKESSCVTPDTLITLADGTQKRVDALDGTEQLLVWNLQTGALDSAPIMFVDSDAEDPCEIVRLQFSDGTTVDVIYEHGFWDYDLNRYVYLDANAADYIGHTFAKHDGESLQEVILTDVVMETRVTTAWSPVTAEHLCYFVNGMLSMPGGVGGLFNFFDVDAETMTYDFEAMARDIETYGLFTYEELNAIAPLSEDMFNAAGGAYLKVSIGKGNMTMDELTYMINRYSKFFPG